MLTPQEVSSKTFPKSVMGGYAMVAVDEFLDKLTEDYSNLYKDNVALKAKIKLLAEKIDESRQTEESFRSLLLSAQKMATEIVSSAEAKRDAIVQEAEAHRAILIGDAETAAKARIAELKDLIEAEEKRLLEKREEVDAAVAAEEYRLERVRVAVGKFTELSRSSCLEQMQILDKLSEVLPPPQVPKEPPKKAETAAKPEPAAEPEQPQGEERALISAETRAVALSPEPAEEASGEEEEEDYYDEEPRGGALSGLRRLFHRDRDEDYDEEEEEEEDVTEDVFSAVARLTEPAEDEDADDADTRVIALDDLQFGRNYNKEK